MLDLTSYPISLQVLMHTDGTVTDLIQLLAKEELTVIKLQEQRNEKTDILMRKIHLQGRKSKVNWLYAESKIHLNNLSESFVNDLTQHNIPIGTLWTKHKIETYKTIINKSEETALNINQSGYNSGDKLLSRTYLVYNKLKVIMEITEKFPISHYKQLSM